MTKRELARIVIDKLTGGNITNPDNKYDERYIMRLADSAIAYIIKTTFWKTRQESSYALPEEFVTIFENHPIKHNESRDIYYSDIPGSIISLPDNRGIEIYPMMDDATVFIHEPFGAFGAWNELPGHRLGDKKAYWLEGRIIRYRNLPLAYRKKTSVVLVKMLASLTGLDFDDRINMPDDMEFELIDLIVQFYREKKNTPEDAVNDNLGTL
jgi:hypothetical protein